MTHASSRNGIRRRMERFWFRPVSAAGFGMMRVAYAAVALMLLAEQWHNVLRYFSDDGMLPRAALPYFLRAEYRFTLLEWADPSQTAVLYAVLFAALIFVLLGVWTRAALLVSTVLLFSFHEYNPVPLDGGDTLLRLLSVILLVSPCDRAFSLSNLRRRFKRVVRGGTDQPPEERTMPVWPYRLLLWQMICIYLSSTWEKLSGTTWLDGSAAAIVLHHPHFSRVPPALADALAPFSPVVTYFVLLAQAAWLLLLVLPLFGNRLPEGMHGTVKRAVLLAGVLMHLGIAVFMDVGVFSYVVFASYLGLLLDDDFRAIRGFFNPASPPFAWLRRTSRATDRQRDVIVLFDGSCGLCRRSVVTVKALDWLHRVRAVDFNDAAARQEHAPDVQLSELERAMHVKLPGGGYAKGFDGFRELCRHLPALWLFWPLLHLPGVRGPGTLIYDRVASKRMRCSDGVCRI